jgi:recombination protein RecA
MQRTIKTEPLSSQIKRKVNKEVEKENEGDFSNMISTGSTLLDLAISGKRIRGGGLPGGILVEAFGPSQSGKTALLSEIAGEIERKEGENQFNDPEARLDEEFARLFGMHLNPKNYFRPDTVTELFKNTSSWEPKNLKVINGIFGDSLAALSTDMEMGNEDGDKMGMRRAKELSEGLRKFCRTIKNKNYLMVCSNQIRINTDGNKYSPKYTTPGGEAVKFYASVRLRFNNPTKIKEEIIFRGKKVERTIGIETEIEVVKTVDTPYRTAPLIILYGYGIDDIRANLQYIKKYTGSTIYCVNDQKLSQSLDEAVKTIENSPYAVKELKDQVIDLWELIDSKFDSNRKKIR